MVFKNQLRRLLASRPGPVLLDVRSEAAYWGKTVDAARGGHLPGADHLPAGRLRADVVRGQAFGPAAGGAIVYARHAVDGIAYMTLIVAGTGTPVRVYPGGWAEWAADGGLPADAESHPASTPAQGVPDVPAVPGVLSEGAPTSWTTIAATGGFGVLLGIMLAMAGLRALKHRKAV